MMFAIPLGSYFVSHNGMVYRIVEINECKVVFRQVMSDRPYFLHKPYEELADDILKKHCAYANSERN